MELAAEDDFLVLACDGVWDVMSDQEVVDFIKVYSGHKDGLSREKFDMIAQRLSMRR